MTTDNTHGVPDHIRIFGKRFEVVLKDPADSLTLKPMAGLSCASQQRIDVSTDQAPEQARDTVLHEVLHVMDYTVQLKLKERQIHALAGAIYAVMMENPGLHRWLFDPVPRE